jgi:hypothetical protein
MNEIEQKLTLDRPVTYQIRVPGCLDDSWSDWDGKLTIAIESSGKGPPVTMLSGILDQAGLQGLLRRLYALGLPLISVNWVQDE